MDMSTDRTGDDFERRLSQSLHAAAPRPSGEVAHRLLSRTAAEHQRRGFSGLRFAPMLAGAAVVAGAVVLGLFFANLLPRNESVGPAPTTSSASALPSSTPAAPSTAATETPAPSVSPSAPAADDVLTCTNPEIGYAASYPADWWANERVEPDFQGGDAVTACTVFAEEPVAIRPNSELPRGVAISIGVSDVVYPPSSGATVVSQEDAIVAGRPAVVREDEQTSSEDPFSYPGQRRYSCFVELPDGRYLVAVTSSQQDQADAVYQEHRRVLDALMDSLDLTGA